MKNVHTQLYRLIQQFINRQEIVFQALKDLRPQILISTGAITRHEIKVLQKSRFYFPQIGFWGEDNTWKYFIHGLGCKLIHVKTKEPLEWNAPNLNSFDIYWLSNWLKWYLESNKDNEILHIAKVKNSDDLGAAILNMLEDFKAEKIIIPVNSQYPSEYTLT